MEARNLTDDPAEFSRKWRGEIDELGPTRLLDALAVVRVADNVKNPDGLIRHIARKGAEPSEVEAAVKRLATGAAEEREKRRKRMQPEERAKLANEYAAQLAEWQKTIAQQHLDEAEEQWKSFSRNDIDEIAHRRQTQFNMQDIRRDREAEPNFHRFVVACLATILATDAGVSVAQVPEPPHISSSAAIWHGG